MVYVCSASMPSLRIIILVGAFFLVLTAPLLLVGPVGGSSEAREAHITALMVDTGNYILPSRRGILPSKPPLFHWLSAGVMQIAAVSPITATRFVSLCAAAFLLVITMYGALRFSEREDDVDGATTAALTAGWILTLTYTFERMRMTAMVDMLLAACTTASALCLLIPIVTTDRTSKFLSQNVRGVQLYGAAFFAAAGVLTKGPLGLALPGFFVLAASLLCHGFGETFKTFFRPHLSWLLFILLCVPWYYLATQEAGDGFVDRQIVFENIARVVGGDLVNAQPWWFYFPSFLRTAAPWSLLAIGLFGLLTRYRLNNLQKDLPLLLVFAGIALFSISTGKRHSYLLPLFPFLSIWLATRKIDYMEFIFRWVPTYKKATTVATILLLLVLTAFFSLALITAPVHGVLAYFQDFLETYRAGLFSSACMSLMVLLLIRVFQPRYSELLSFRVTALAVIAILASTGEGLKNYLKGFDRMAAVQRQLIPVGDSIGIVRHVRDEYFDPLMMYLQRPVQILNPDTLADGERPDWILLQRRDVAFAESLGIIGSQQITFRQPSDVVQGRTDRDIILLKIQP